MSRQAKKGDCRAAGQSRYCRDMAEIKSRAGAENLLKRLAHISALLGCAVATRDQEVLNVQEKHNPLITQLSGEIAAGEALLDAWATAHRKEEFEQGKTLETASGWLRFRLGNRATDLLEGWDDKKVLEKLKAGGKRSFWYGYVAIKESVDRRKILADSKTDAGREPKLTPAKLKSVGLAIKQEERFEVEYKPEPVTAALA